MTQTQENRVLFQKIFNDLIEIIDKFEINLKKITPEYNNSNKSKLSLWNKLKSYFSPSNQKVSENNINEFASLVVSNFHLNLQENNQVSELIKKFRNDIKDIFLKYDTLLKQEDLQKKQIEKIKKTGEPDPTPTEDIKKAYKDKAIKDFFDFYNNQNEETKKDLQSFLMNPSEFALDDSFPILTNLTNDGNLRKEILAFFS